MTLIRKTPLKAKTPLRRAKPNAQCNAQNAQKGRRKVQKAAQKAPARFRSRQYLDWVKQQRCCNCLAPADDPHHLTGMWNLSGMALTAPDSFAMPLCRPCHDTVHADPAMQWMQPIWLVDTINAGLEQFAEGPIHDALQEALAFVREKTA